MEKCAGEVLWVELSAHRLVDVVYHRLAVFGSQKLFGHLDFGVNGWWKDGVSGEGV
jgi:hypothetical protein